MVATSKATTAQMVADWVTRLPAITGVLQPVQERGRNALTSLGLPSRRQEDWRLTDLACL